MPSSKGAAKPKSPCSKKAAAEQPPQEMQATGQSKEAKQARANQYAKGDAFLKYISEHSAELSARWGNEWASIPEEEMTMAEVWGHLASFLADVYTIEGHRNHDEKLKIKSAHGIWTGLLYQARGRLGTSLRQETKVCLPGLRARCRAQQCAERAFVLSVLSVLAQDFFKNIDDETTALGIWYKGIKKNMQRLIAQRIAW